MFFLKGLQIHLSTALICMIVAGALLGMNVLVRPVYVPPELKELMNDRPDIPDQLGNERGWPFGYYSEFTKEGAKFLTRPGTDIFDYTTPFWRGSYLLLDVAISVAIVAMIAFAFEKRIRSVELKVQKPQKKRRR
jgi:hypothetical protein